MSISMRIQVPTTEILFLSFSFIYFLFQWYRSCVLILPIFMVYAHSVNIICAHLRAFSGYVSSQSQTYTNTVFTKLNVREHVIKFRFFFSLCLNEQRTTGNEQLSFTSSYSIELHPPTTIKSFLVNIYSKNRISFVWSTLCS